MVNSSAAAAEILIADDDVISRTALRKMIASRGLAVIEAASAELTSRWLGIRPIKLLVLSANLGDASGLDLLARVVQLHPAVQIVLVVGSSRPDFVDGELRERGLRGYLKDLWMKPFNLRRIQAVLDAVFPRELQGPAGTPGPT